MFELQARDSEINALVKKNEYRQDAVALLDEKNRAQALAVAGMRGTFEGTNKAYYDELGNKADFNIAMNRDSGRLTELRHRSIAANLRMQGRAARREGGGDAVGSLLGGALAAADTLYTDRRYRRYG
jgi:hypothetical protein